MSTTVADIKSGQKPQNPVAAFSGFLDKLKPQLALSLPKHLTADRMARLALTAFSSTPKLQECDPKTIAASIMTAGQLGLEPGVNGAGFLVPYGRTCTFVPGWKGLVDLVARSGRGTVFTGVIFKDQEYTYTDGARRDLIIHNESDLEEPEDITHAYAIGWVKDASMPIIELWRVTKIRKHRDKYNKVGKAHYSFRDWEMYSRKIPLLQVLKYMPCSIEVQNAIAVSNAAERGHLATFDAGMVIDVGGDDENGEGSPAISAAAQAALDAINAATDLSGITRALSGLKPADKAAVKPYAEARQAEIKAARQPDPQDDALTALEQRGSVDQDTGEWTPSPEEMAAIHAREIAEGGGK